MVKSTKKALFASLLSFVLCISMLVGTTFAWFTDTDTATTSNIVAGTLDIEIVDAAGQELDTLDFVNANGDKNILWEPNATFQTVGFKFVNKGNLALKYKVQLNNTEISYNKLNEVIKFTLVKADGTELPLTSMVDLELLPNGETDIMHIKGYMDAEAGNEYQGLELAGVSITVYAAQSEEESDMTDSTYDKNAEYDDDIITVGTADEFLKAFANFEEGATVTLTKDIDLTGKTWTPVMNKAFTLNGNGHTITGMNNALVGTTAAKEYTVKDVTFKNLSINNCFGGISVGLIGYADTCAYINMTNVTIDGATITGAEYVGGFAGYTSGYGVDTNGPVNASHNFTNCTIKNATLTSTADGSVGGLIGHAGSNAATTTRVNGFSYFGVSMAQATSRPDKTGNMIGTCNVGVVYINDADIDVAVDLGRFVPSTTGKLVINGVDQVEFKNDAADPIVNVEIIAPDANPENVQNALNDAINNATTEGNTSISLPAGTYTAPTKDMQNKDITFSGGKDVVVDMSDAPLGHTQAPSGADVTFNGITVKFDNTENYTGLAHTKKVVYKDCTIIGKQTLYSDAEFINCTFINANDYAVWTWGAKNVIFTNCTFQSGGKALLVYADTTTENFTCNVVLTDCIFNDDDSLNTVKAAVEVGKNPKSPANETTVYNITMNGCEVNGFAINDEGENTNSTFYGNKNSMSNDLLNVFINGTEVH